MIRLGLILGLVAGSPGPPVDGPAPPQATGAARRVRAEAPAALADLESRLAHLECSGRKTITLRGENTWRSDDFRLKIRGPDAIASSGANRGEFGPATFRRVVYGEGAGGRFMIREPADGGPPIVKRDGEAPHAGRMLEAERATWIRPLTRGLFREGRTLRDVIGDPAFRIDRAEEVERDGRPHVRVEYELRGGVGGRPFLEKGEFVLAPHLRWTFREFEARDQSRPAPPYLTRRFEVEFADAAEGLPAARRVESRIWAGESDWSRQVLEVGSWSYRDVPEEEFRPEFYARARDRP